MLRKAAKWSNRENRRHGWPIAPRRELPCTTRSIQPIRFCQPPTSLGDPPVNIHPLAIVSPQALIGNHVTIGPFAVVESDVVIGEGCRVAAHCVIKEGTTLGPNNEICEAA